MLKKILSASVFDILTLLVPIIILPFLVVKASSSEMADYLFIFLLIMTCQQVVDYSFTYIAGRMTEPELFNEFNNIISSKIILCVISTSISIFLSAAYLENVSPILLFAIFFGCLNSLFSAQWLYISTGGYERYSVISLPSRLVVFITVLGFPSIYGFECFMLLNFSLVCIYNLCIFSYKCREIGVINLSFNLKSAVNNIKENYHLFIADFIPQLYVTLPLIFFKGFWLNSSYIALSIAYRLYNAGMTVQWTSLKVAIAEDKIFNTKNIRRIFLFVLSLASIKILIVFSFAIYILELMFKQQSAEILYFLKILSLGFIGAALYIGYGYAVAILNKSERDFKLHAFYLSFPAMLVVWVCSFQFGEFGYAISLVFARFMNGIYFYFNYKKMVFEQ